MKMWIIVLFLMISCFACKTRSDVYKPYIYEGKCIQVLSQHMDGFIFEYRQFQSDIYSKLGFAYVILPSGKEITLFEDYHAYFGDSLIHALEDYYLFNYWSGGNSCRSTGYHLVKITPDTAFHIGLVCGFEDLDSNGIKEFYYNKIVVYGDCIANHLIKSFPCIIQTDSIIYPDLSEPY